MVASIEVLHTPLETDENYLCEYRWVSFSA